MMSHSVPPISITNGSTDIISYLEIVITGIKHFRKYFDRHLVQSQLIIQNAMNIQIRDLMANINPLI